MDPNVSPSGTGYNTNMGYCTHSSNIFTTWHRPYLAFLEVCTHSLRYPPLILVKGEYINFYANLL